MNRFLENIGNKVSRALTSPEQIIPYLGKKMQEVLSYKSIAKILEAHDAVFLAKGTSKEVYRIPFSFHNGEQRDYVVAFIHLPVSCRKKPETCIQKMRNTRKWYEDTFGKSFVNHEKLLSLQKHRGIIAYVQPFLEVEEKKKDLFYDIPQNIQSIKEEMKTNNFFREQMQKLAGIIITQYLHTGMLPDLFNSQTEALEHNPANLYLTKDNKLVFLDTHTVFGDTRLYQVHHDEQMMIRKITRAERFQYVDELLSSLENIRDFGEK